MAPDGGGGGDLWAVSCATVSSCVAVGNDGSSAFVDMWKNGRWAAMSRPAFGAFDGVSCPTTHVCLAVAGSGTKVLTARLAF
jgi:hypothetical protein